MPSKYSKIAAAQQAEKTKTAAGEGDGVRYNLKNTTDKNVVSIKQQIENVAQELNAADPVARITAYKQKCTAVLPVFCGGSYTM